MSYDQLFEICNLIVLPAWLSLIIAPNWKWTSRIVVSITVTILAICYIFLVFQAIQPGDFAKFATLEGIMTLFSGKEAVLAGWIHYLAFDLMAGWVIAFDAMRTGINRYVIIPCLLFTFMLGPLGFLLYLLLRLLITKKYFFDWDL